MPTEMKHRARGLAVAWTAIVLLACVVPGGAVAAESKEKGPAAKQAAPAQVDKSGTAHVSSTKASGAAAVAKTKACFGDAPKIERVAPDEGKAGETVTITGKNFGAAGCLASVSFGPGNAATFKHENESTVTVTVPESGKKGIRLLTVTTASGEDSKPFLVK